MHAFISTGLMNGADAQGSTLILPLPQPLRELLEEQASVHKCPK